MGGILKSCWKVKYVSMKLCLMVMWSQNGNVQAAERAAFTLLSYFPLKDCRCSCASKSLKLLVHLKSREKSSLWLFLQQYLLFVDRCQYVIVCILFSSFIPLCQKKFKHSVFLDWILLNTFCFSSERKPR